MAGSPYAGGGVEGGQGGATGVMRDGYDECDDDLNPDGRETGRRLAGPGGLLRERIVNAHLAPGARLGMDALRSELGVSRTQLREALSHLARDRMVVTRPRSGISVAFASLRDISDICELRRGMEWQVLRRVIVAHADTPHL